MTQHLHKRQSALRWLCVFWTCYLEALEARRPSRSACCQGCQPGSGTSPSPAAEPGWLVKNRTAAPPGGSRVPRPKAGLPGSSANEWRVSGRPKLHSEARRCRRGTRRLTRWGLLPSADLEGEEKGLGVKNQDCGHAQQDQMILSFLWKVHSLFLRLKMMFFYF